MGYSKSKRAVRKVEPYLVQMVDAQGEIQFPAEEPSDFAYRLREGIYAAKENALDQQKNPVQPFAQYASLNAKYLIRVKGPMVVCEPRDIVPIARLRVTLGHVNIPEVHDTLGIIGAAITHKAPVMIFPDAKSELIEPRKVYTWAQTNGYFLVLSDAHLTLTKEDPGALAWKP